MTTATKENRHIEYMPLAVLKEAKRNPKRHDMETIDASFMDFGYVAPIVLDERTGRLVAGHGRLRTLGVMREASKGKKAKIPRGIRLNDSGEWMVPIYRGWASKDDKEAERYLLADNRIPEIGGIDNKMLATILKGFEEPDLKGIGYTPDDVAAIIASVAPPLSLDELASKYGEHDDEKFWPKIQIQVSPAVKKIYDGIMEKIEGKTDGEKFGKLIRAVEPHVKRKVKA